MTTNIQKIKFRDGTDLLNEGGITIAIGEVVTIELMDKINKMIQVRDQLLKDRIIGEIEKVMAQNSHIDNYGDTALEIINIIKNI